jgi:hypothetical protein
MDANVLSKRQRSAKLLEQIVEIHQRPRFAGIGEMVAIGGTAGHRARLEPDSSVANDPKRKSEAVANRC